MPTYTHKITDTYQTDAGVLASIVVPYTGDIEVGTDTSILASTTNEPLNVNWLFAKCKAIMLWASGACTIKTNGFTLTGNTHTTTTIDGLSTTAGLAVGQTITGAGIPAATTISSINAGASSIVISNAATATATGVTLTVGPATATIDTVALAAGQLINWGNDHPEVCPIAHDVVNGLFVTNPGTAAVSLKIRTLLSA